MADTPWAFRGLEFANCNCAYGCPCQFLAPPTHRFCEAVAGFHIDEGSHGETRLDDLNVVLLLHWPGPIHEGHGVAVVVVDERAGPAQRESLLRIASGQDTKPGATVFQVFSTTLDKVHDPIFAPIQFEVDVDARRARLAVPGITEGHGEPIINPITKAAHRARISLPNGFEYDTAEIGRGWTKASGGPMTIELSDSHAHFARLHLTQNGAIH